MRKHLDKVCPKQTSFKRKEVFSGGKQFKKIKQDQRFPDKKAFKEHPYKIWSQLDQQFQRRRFSKKIFKKAKKNSWKKEKFLIWHNLNKLDKGPPKEHPYKIWSQLDQ